MPFGAPGGMTGGYGMPQGVVPQIRNQQVSGISPPPQGLPPGPPQMQGGPAMPPQAPPQMQMPRPAGGPVGAGTTAGSPFGMGGPGGQQMHAMQSPLMARAGKRAMALAR